MTIENDYVNLNPTPLRKSYNPFESDDETLDTLGRVSKDDHIGFDLKEFEQSASPLTFLVDNGDSLWEDGEPYDNNVPLVSKDIGVDEGENKVSHDQLDVLEAPKHVDGVYQDVLTEKCMVHEDTLMKKAKDNFSDKERNILVQPHEVMNPNEENKSTKPNNNIAFGSNSPTNSDPRKQEDNLQSATRHEQASSVTFSGPITYTGSVSIRSESSTTSTGSFAFPRLQNEWNSSPVRMAKADRRHYKNRRRWVTALVCCRSF